MKAKKGISLIVLVITIIVIIILAAAVLLTLNNNNPIENSKQAVVKNDAAEIKSSVALYVANFIANDANNNGPFSDTVTISGTTTTNDPKYATTAGTDTTTQSTTLSWTALGFEAAPASISSATYDPDTGAFTFTENAGYPDVDPVADPE